MGRREGDLARFCCLVFLLMIYGSGGLSVSSPFAISPSSTNQDLLAAPLYSVESRNIQAPSPLILPIGSVAHPPVIPPSKSEVASPMVQGIVPSAQLSSPPYHSMSGSVSTSPSIQTQSPSAVSPVIHSSAPSVSISSLTPAIYEHKSPRLISQPHAYQAPNIFHSSDHDLSPSHVNPPSIQVRNGTPASDTWRKLPNGSQLTLPHAAAPAPTIVPFSPPGVQPNVPKLAPSMTLLPGAKELSGPAVTPVVAPTTGTSNHLSPTNNSQIDGSSPAISPMPLESNVTHAPSTMHPHSPEGRITASPMLAPEISIPGHEDGKRGGNPTLVPSYPSASSHPPAPFENNRRGHYPRTAFVQAPVVSPAHHPSPIPKDNMNYASPVISPASLFPSPWNNGRLHTPPFVISPAPGHPPPENPKHRIRHLAPLSVEGPEDHPIPSHHPPPFSKNNRRPHAPSPYIDGPVVIPAPSHPPMDIQKSPYFPPVQAPVFSPSDEKAAITQSPLTPRRHNRWPIHYPVPSPSIYSKRSQSPLPQSIHALPLSPHNFGPAVSPVVAPTSGTSTNLSPTKNSQFYGSSPAISPMPLESNVTHAPSTMHPHSPEGRITASPMLAPEISIPRHEDGKRVENPTLAPSYPSASPHPSAPFENNRRGHYPPTAFVQAPVVSPAHRPSPIPNDNRNYVPPVISPAPFFPSPWIKGRFRTPPFVISPAPGNPPTENPKHRIRHLAPPPCVEGPEVHPTPSHHPTPFSKNNRRPHAPSPYVDGPVVIPAPSHPPMDIQRSKKNHHQGPYFPPVQAPFFSSSGEKAVTPTQSPLTPQRHNRWPIHYPVPAPSIYSKRPQSPLRSIHALPPSPPNFGPLHYPASSPSTYSIGSQSPLLQPIQALPPPPPNLDCGPITCQEPLANPPPASPCTCVLPIKVGLRLGVALYTFFPLVSAFAQEISSGIFMKQSQVRIMGANAASEDPEKTIVLIDLVPLKKYFDNTTVILTYVKFWHKQIVIQPSYFGDYDVLYVQYPGLPPSPPSAPGYVNVNGGAYSSGNNARAIQPLGVDVRRQKGKLSGSLIAIIVLSSVMASFLIVGAACFLLLRRREHSDLPAASSQPLQTHLPKPSASGTAPMTAGGSVPSSTSASFSSSIATLAGSAKSYSLVEMEKATNKFDDSKIIGEGGFGRVYLGILEDGARVAVKVLKRDDHQGGREFLAEVEMLSRLHHRNLVKLMGICTEENARCLVYELIPNGSLESHLHGVDKEVSPLDWNTRMKIALGAARGLAYLHEDSSPRVIHRDFKSSNILLEHDFTPKVSDFGLARTALDEGNVHISTRVMGTFGYVAPEYAMTGHLLVKSDVYSYGVVLLELLTGRKPVDMSQPLGQENLVSWARPLLSKAEGLEMLIDPALGTNYPHDSIAKIAAIASMCVHPEVSHRPFMGEVVQALKLVCSESDESRHSESCSNEETSTRATDTRINIGLCQGPEMIGSSQSVMFYTSAGFTGDASGLLQMHSSSGPLRTGRGSHFWHRLRELASGSVSEHHRFAHRFWTAGSDHSPRWP